MEHQPQVSFLNAPSNPMSDEHVGEKARLRGMVNITANAVLDLWKENPFYEVDDEILGINVIPAGIHSLLTHIDFHAKHKTSTTYLVSAVLTEDGVIWQGDGRNGFVA